MNGNRNVVLGDSDDDELVDICEKLKLYDRNVIDVITEDAQVMYDKERLLHTSYTISKKISEDVSDIRRKTGLSMNKICRGIVMHGASIIHNKYDKMASDIDVIAGRLIRITDMEYVKKMANPISITQLESSTDHPMKSNTRFVDWSITYLTEFGARSLVNKIDMIRSAFCFSLSTWDDAININVYTKEMKNLDDYMTQKIFILDAVYNRYEERQLGVHAI